MKDLQKGDHLQIQCYKHDGKIHRCWDEAILLDVKKDYMVLAMREHWLLKLKEIDGVQKNRLLCIFLKIVGITLSCN